LFAHFVAFSRKVIEDNPSEAERTEAFLDLGRHFVLSGDYEGAELLLKDYSHSRHIKESTEVQSLEFEVRNLRPGMKMPSFSCATLSGKDVTTKDLLGTRSILLFWSPTCGASRQLMEAFLLAPIPAFSVLYVALAEDPTRVDEFLTKLDIAEAGRTMICVEGKSYSGTMSKRFNIFVTPTAFLTDEEGTILETARGHDAIRASIKRILESGVRGRRAAVNGLQRSTNQTD
jgi:hypothetical protein